MSEMVERVARAMHAAGENVEPGLGSRAFRKLMLVVARAAIEEMREPTEEMVNAASDVEAVARTEDATVGYLGARYCWRAMIDAALKP